MALIEHFTSGHGEAEADVVDPRTIDGISLTPKAVQLAGPPTFDSSMSTSNGNSYSPATRMPMTGTASGPSLKRGVTSTVRSCPSRSMPSDTGVVVPFSAIAARSAVTSRTASPFTETMTSSASRMPSEAPPSCGSTTYSTLSYGSPMARSAAAMASCCEFSMSTRLCSRRSSVETPGGNTDSSGTTDCCGSSHARATSNHDGRVSGLPSTFTVSRLSEPSVG